MLKTIPSVSLLLLQKSSCCIIKILFSWGCAKHQDPSEFFLSSLFVSLITHRVWPDPRSFWKVLTLVPLNLLQPTTVSHPAGTRVSGWTPSRRGALEREKGIEDYALTLLYPEPPNYFICMTFLHLRGHLPFKWHLGIWGPLAIFFLFPSSW